MSCGAPPKMGQGLGRTQGCTLSLSARQSDVLPLPTTAWVALNAYPNSADCVSSSIHSSKSNSRSAAKRMVLATLPAP